MNKYLSAILSFLIVFSFTKAHAGWYECYNFKGTISKSPITISIQVREGYFGEQDKKQFNLIGVYKYDNRNNPIKLEGQLNTTTKKVLLYEPDNSGYTAVFSFNFSETEITGTWTDIKTNQSLPLHLTFVSKLVDTLDASQFKDVQILQTEALPDFYFVGVYSKTAETNRAKMDKLLIFKSDDNSLFQTIDFAEVEKNTETETGNIMTIIFDNVSIENAERKKLMISNNMDQMNGYLELGYNSKKKKFILNPIPQLGCRE